MDYWLAIRTVGIFRKGHVYRKEQLGILGRMAIRSGYLVPADELPSRVRTTSVDGKTKVTRPRGARRKRMEEAGGKQADVQAGGSAEVSDNSGA